MEVVDCKFKKTGSGVGVPNLCVIPVWEPLAFGKGLAF